MDRVDLFQRALRFRIEDADGVDLVIQQLDAIGHVRAHRVDVEQPATHGEVPRIHHLRNVSVAGAFKPAFLAVKFEPGAKLEVETAAGNVLDGRQSLQQGLHRDDNDAAPE